METLTAEQFTKKYGQDGLSKFEVGTTVGGEQFNRLYGQPQSPAGDSVQTPGALGKAGRFLGLDALGRGLGQAAFSLTKEKKELDRLLDEGKISSEEYESITTGGLTNKEVIGSAVQTTALFAPGAAAKSTLKTKTAAGAATGFTFDVAGNLQANKEGTDIFKPGMGTVIGGGLPLAASTLKGLVKITGLTPKGLERTNLRLTPTEAQNLNKKGKLQPVVDYLARKKIIGTPEKRFAKVDQLYDKMEDAVQSKVSQSGKVFKKQDIIDDLVAIPDRYADNLSEYQNVVGKIQRMVRTLQTKYGDDIPAEVVNSIKRNEFKNAYSKNNTDVINEVSHSVGEALKSRLDKSIPGLEKLNNEYGIIITARRILGKAQTRNQSGVFGRAAGSVVGGSVGASLGGFAGAGVGGYLGQAAVNKASTPIRSTMGAGIQTFTNVIDKIPTDKAGNLQITKKALLNLINSVR